jgi:hypothetical protein
MGPLPVGDSRGLAPLREAAKLCLMRPLGTIRPTLPETCNQADLRRLPLSEDQ